MKIISSTSLAAMYLIVLGSFTFAQTPPHEPSTSDKYTINAKAGGVNYLEGTVEIRRKSGYIGRLLKGDAIQIGDRVSTGGDGRAEILLNPGSYVRLGGNTSFEFRSVSLDDLQLRIYTGTAIFEVYAGDDFFVTVASPKAKFKLINSGVFRLDVSQDGTGTLSVWKGRAQVGKTQAGIIKAGRSISVSDSKVSVAKFERGEGDVLDQWSKGRGKQQAKLTNSLQKRDLRRALISSYNGRQWNTYDSFGIWVYDRFSGMNCFLPFGYGWYSPYGYGYGRYLGSYDLPVTVYFPPVYGGGTSNPGGSPTSEPPSTTTRVRPYAPPYVRMQGAAGNGREAADTRVFGNENNSPMYIPAPTYTPPPMSQAPSGRPEKVDAPTRP